MNNGSKRLTILVADAETSVIVALKLLLDSEGMVSEACRSHDALLARIAEKKTQLAPISTRKMR